MRKKKKKNKKKKRRKKSKNNYKKNDLKIPEFNNDIEYENWKYKNNLLEKKKKNKGINEYDYYFSRGIQKLEGHNGDNKRVEPEQHFYIDGDEREYEDEDLEEENEEEKENQQLNDTYEDDNINNNIYEEDNYELDVEKEKKGSKHNLSFVISKLEKIIDLISDNNGGEDNLIHVALFIFTGIFIIFIIDNAFRMGANLRD